MTTIDPSWIELVWEMVWQIALLVVATGVAVHFVGKRHPHLAYALWMIPLAKCLVPLAGATTISLWGWLPAPPLPFGAEPAAAVERLERVDQSAWSEAADRAPFAPSVPSANLDRRGENKSPSPSQKAPTPNPSPEDGGGGSGAGPESTTDQQAGAGDASWLNRASVTRIGFTIWFAGTLILIGVAIGRSRERSAVLNEWIANDNDCGLDDTDHLESLALRLEKGLGLRRPVSVAITRGNRGPAVSGLFSPIISLPKKFVDEWTAEKLEAMLTHELIHVRRGDTWIGYVQFLVQAIWWFHPAVWWMNRQIGIERERCCDEETLVSLGGDRSTYARSLVDVLAAKQTLTPLPWHPGARPALITARRLEEIMKRTNMTRNRTPYWCWPIVAIVAVFALPGGIKTVATSAEPSDSAVETADTAADSKASSDDKKTPTLLKYGDGKADGKRSLGGTGEMIRFDLPDGIDAIRAIKIHASRYGYPKPPDEDFEITFASEDFSEILHTENAPYRLFKRGKNKWVNVKFKEPVELPKTFWIVLDFHAERTKGVYVSFDTATKGKHSRIGLAGDDEPKEVDFSGDWMVRVVLARPKAT